MWNLELWCNQPIKPIRHDDSRADSRIPMIKHIPLPQIISSYTQILTAFKTYIWAHIATSKVRLIICILYASQWQTCPGDFNSKYESRMIRTSTKIFAHFRTYIVAGHLLNWGAREQGSVLAFVNKTSNSDCFLTTLSMLITISKAEPTSHVFKTVLLYLNNLFSKSCEISHHSEIGKLEHWHCATTSSGVALFV